MTGIGWRLTAIGPGLLAALAAGLLLLAIRNAWAEADGALSGAWSVFVQSTTQQGIQILAPTSAAMDRAGNPERGRRLRQPPLQVRALRPALATWDIPASARL